MQEQGAGFLLAAPQVALASEQITVSYGFLQNAPLGSEATLVAQLQGGPVTSAAFTASLQPAVSAWASLLSDASIAYDKDISGANIVVAVQVRDQAYNVLTSTSGVTVTAAIQGTSTVLSASCAPSATI